MGFYAEWAYMRGNRVELLIGWIIQGDCRGLAVMILLGMKFEKIFKRISFSFITFKFGQSVP